MMSHRWDRFRAPAMDAIQNPLLVFGNQKSGTSAIAALLGLATGKSVLVDLFFRFGRQSLPVLRGEQPLESIWNRSASYLAHDILKEPEFLLFTEELEQLYPQSPRLFIVREPLDNIRSLLNRIDCPGNVDSLPVSSRRLIESSAPLWLPVVDGPRPELAGKSLCETMAIRWKFSARIYLDSPERYHLVTYESFLKDRVGHIASIAETLGWDVKHDISDQVSKPFQKPGKRTQAIDFFGKESMNRIIEICGEEMQELGYPLPGHES